MHFLIGMTTAPRPGGYVVRAVASLQAAGFAEAVHLFAEPGTDFGDFVPYPPDAVLFQRDRQLGCYRNWRVGLEILLDRVEDPDDWIMMLQDDVIWRSGSRALLEQVLTAADRATLGFVSPYASPAMVPAPYRQAPPLADQHWPFPQFYRNAFWGALALVFTPASARALAELPRFRDHNHHRKLDVLIGNCMRDLGLIMRIAVPSLCDHIGEVSTIGRDRIIQNRWARRGFRFQETS